MIYLQTGFVGEGETDHDFLAPLAARLCAELASTESQLEFEIPDPEPVHLATRAGNAPRQVVDQVLSSHSHLDILFYHTDAASDVSGAYDYRVNPVVQGLASSGVRVIGMVPRREMEAWALADPIALCRVLGFDAERVSVPGTFRPSRVEGINDPKMELRLFSSSQGRSSRRSRRRSDDSSEGFLRSLALDINLSTLAGVPQFGRLRSDVLDYFNSRGWL